MKKMMLVGLISVAAFVASADVITNTVVIVSNFYSQAFIETVVTQKVKSSHTDYYYTNHEHTVTHDTLIVSQTNLSVNVDIGRDFVIAASNQANRAESAVGDSRSYADAAARSSTSAASAASAAASSASAAAATRSAAASECADALATINARINWFDEHSGETITQVNSNITINVNAQDYSFPYTNAAGVAFNYVTVHPYGQNGGVTVSPRSSSAYSTVAIRAWPRPRESGWWDFYPAYVDYDANGMRLQYLPDTTVPIKYVGGEGVYPNGWIVPEYFYWQSGYIYMKVRVWEGGAVVAWCITRYSWANWPNTIGYGGDNGTWMELVDRQGYGPSSMPTSQLSAFYSATRTASQGQSIEFPMQASSSYAATLQWMREGPKFTDLEGRVDSLATQWQSVGAECENICAAWPEMLSGMEHLSNMVVNAQNGHPHAYVSPDGTAYPNIIYYDRATDNGKVAVSTVGNYYPSLEYRFVPAYGGDATENYWIFEPAYVDTDANGLRLHYLPKSAKTITAKTYNAGYVYVPRDFYWQNGIIYAVVDSFNGSTFSGRIRVKYAGTAVNEYPNGLLHAQSGASLGLTMYRQMTFDLREGTIMGAGTNISTCYLKTEQGKVMQSYDSVLWIPERPSVGQQPIVDWLAGFVR